MNHPDLTHLLTITSLPKMLLPFGALMRVGGFMVPGQAKFFPSTSDDPAPPIVLRSVSQEHDQVAEIGLDFEHLVDFRRMNIRESHVPGVLNLVLAHAPAREGTAGEELG